MYQGILNNTSISISIRTLQTRCLNFHCHKRRNNQKQITLVKEIILWIRLTIGFVFRIVLIAPPSFAAFPCLYRACATEFGTE